MGRVIKGIVTEKKANTKVYTNNYLYATMGTRIVVTDINAEQAIFYSFDFLDSEPSEFEIGDRVTITVEKEV